MKRLFPIGCAALVLAAGCGNTTAEDAGGATSSGSTSSNDEGAEESAEGSGSAESGGASTCPDGADLNLGDCAAQGDSCMHLDFDCECLCNCGEAEPGEPGNWNCEYNRSDELVNIDDASLSLDCSGETVSGTMSLTFDNTGGQADVELTPKGINGVQLSIDDQPYIPCGGLCGQGQSCPDYDPLTVSAGEQVPLRLAFGPGACGQTLDPPLCDFCGHEARISFSASLASVGVNASVGDSIDGVAITCP